MIIAILVALIIQIVILGIALFVFHFVYTDEIRNGFSDRKLFDQQVKNLQEVNRIERESYKDRLTDLRDDFQNRREDLLLRIEKLETERDEWRDKAMIRSNYTPMNPENRIPQVPTEVYMPHRAAQESALKRFENHQFPEVEELSIEA